MHLWIAVCGLLVHMTRLGGCVRWSTDGVQAAAGEDIELTCMATLRMFDVLQLVWTNDDGAELVIAEDSSLKDAFKNTGRYTLAFDVQGEDSTSTLTYTGITGDDAGRLCCFTINFPDDKACIAVDVKVPVTSIRIVHIAASGAEREMPPGGKVLLKEGEDMGVACEAVTEGTDGAPHMTIKAGGRVITSEFIQPSKAVDSLTSGILTELPRKSNTHRLEYRTMYPSPDFNEQHLECIAEQPGGSKDVTVQLQVEYSPILTCSAYEYFSEHGARVSFSCDLRAYPGATVSWSYTAQADQTDDIVNHPGNVSIQTHETAVSLDHTKIHLTIPAVEESHFTRYFVEATNDIGDETLEITLTEGIIPVETEKPIPETVPVTSPTTKLDEQQTEASTEKELHISVVTIKGTGRASQSTQDNSATSVQVNIVTLMVSIVFILFGKSSS